MTGSPQAPVPGIEKALDAHPSRPGDTAAILFTSGTTGPSRGMRCPHAQFAWRGRNVADSLRLTAEDTLYTCLPLFHTNALNTLAQAMTPLWSVFRERFGVTLVNGFGSTETNLVIGSVPEDCRPGRMGTVRDGFEARVVDADLSCVPDGRPGKLVVRTDQEHAFATGYVGDATLDPGAWRRTGDRVVRDADGWFRFVDRVKDCIRRRGENISSYEVETALRAHPDIAEAAAFPVPSALAEDEVMVAVVPRAGRVLDPAQVARHCAGELPAFAVPRYVDVVAALPLTETGKVRKSVLRERGVTGGTWDRCG
ncbi:AMP-binding protein [Streptomyces minutiscleroticus]|uniref:AMP-binding protein n=1 Tax=Streptomyces minutiscleroticus TaxID=68238 RepID=UPI003323F34D